MNIEMLKNNGIDVDASLELLGDMETYNETLREFLKSFNEKLENIKKYKETSDMNNYAIYVHSLKSDSKYLGFTKLAELAYNHEMASKENDSAKVFEDFDNLLNEASRIKRVISSYLGEPIEIPKEIVNDENKQTILVVDDSDIVRTFIKKVFNDTYNVVLASDGREAIEKINNGNVICMLLDLNMPNVNGFEVLNYFRENNLFVKVPVSIITGEDSKENVDRAFTYPIADVLSKPFNERDIKRVVEKTLEYK